MADPICETWWLDDYGRDHGCQEDHGHTGGHECGCGARAPRWMLDRIDAALADLEHVRTGRATTHHDACWDEHVACLAARIRRTLTGEDA